MGLTRPVHIGKGDIVLTLPDDRIRSARIGQLAERERENAKIRAGEFAHLLDLSWAHLRKRYRSPLYWYLLAFGIILTSITKG